MHDRARRTPRTRWSTLRPRPRLARAARAPTACAPAARGGNDMDDDDAPLRVYPPAGRGRQKQKARVKPMAPCRQLLPTDRYSAVSARQREDCCLEEEEVSRSGPGPGPAVDPPVVDAHAIPISEHTSRVMPGQLDINKRFSKGYIRTTIKQTPLPNMTQAPSGKRQVNIRNNM